MGSSQGVSARRDGECNASRGKVGSNLTVDRVLPRSLSERRHALTAEEESKQHNTRTPDVDRFRSVWLRSCQFRRGCRTEHFRREFRRKRVDRDVPYGGLPHRSFSSRSCPLYLKTVARPKSEILRLPVRVRDCISSLALNRHGERNSAKS